MTRPSISVVLPTYNRTATLPRAIDSVLAQTFRDLELIVVDDASTDGTEALVRSQPDPRVRYLRLARNRGAAGARNTGIAAAIAPWIAFQDSDDEWLPEKLEQQWAEARAAPDNVGLVLGGYTAELPSGALAIKPSSLLAGGAATPDVLEGWPIITPTWLARRSVLQECQGFDETFPCLEDWDLVMRMTQLCESRAVAGPVLVKHQALDSICNDPGRLAGALARILERHGARWQGHEPMKSRRLAHLGVLRYQLGEPDRARRALAAAWSAHPLALAPPALLLASFGGPRVFGRVALAFPRHSSMAP